MNDKFSMNTLPSFQEIEQELGFSQNASKQITSSDQGTASSSKGTASPLNPERFMVDESLIDKDYSYMKKVCPSLAGQVSDWIEDECDRLEYEGSFLYDQYPDKTTILKMTDRIASKLPSGITVTPKELIQALLCDEIFYRRCRYYRKKKLFSR